MPQFKLLLCATTCLAIVVGTSAQNRFLTITSHESLSSVYVDGVEQPLENPNQKNATDTIVVPRESRLVAVQAVSTIDFCAGFIASVTNDYRVTDGSWKCSEFGAEGWYELGYDDSDVFDWPYAFVVGPNGNVSGCSDLTELIPEISLAASWIWTLPPTGSVSTPLPRSGPGLLVDRAVFCRGYLPFCATYVPCRNGGTCLENSETLCECSPEWAGRYCERVWTPCANEPCLNNGICTITSDNTYHCACSPQYTGVNCETTIKNRNLTITAKSTIYDLYIDGVRQANLTHANNWTTADVVPLPLNARLIGVMAIDSTESCAGILGSVTDNYLVTDGINWRCGYIPDVQWFQLGWDDAEWPLAHAIHDNTTVNEACDLLNNVPPISPLAQWIWTDKIEDAPYYHQTVYCRGYLPLCNRESPCYNGGTCYGNNETLCGCLVGFVGEYCQTVDLKNMSITAKEDLYAAYVDGVPQNLVNGDDWRRVDSFRINTTSRLIALMAVQLEGPCPGILASVRDSVGDYVLTNATWKCSGSAVIGWQTLGFDDSLWSPARIIHPNDITNETQCQNNFDVISEISPDAYWIWTNNPTGQDVVAFCRGYLPLCSVSPCKNGGICNANLSPMCTCASDFEGIYCDKPIPNVNDTESSDDTEEAAASGQKLDDTANTETNVKPIPLPFVVPSATAAHAPLAPAEKSRETGHPNLHKALTKDQEKATG